MNPRPLVAAAIGWSVWGGLLVAILLFTEDRKSALLRSNPGSTEAMTTRGTSRLYRALQEIGAPVGRIREGGVLPRDTTLVIVDPPTSRASGHQPGSVDRASIESGNLNVVVVGTREQILLVCPFMGEGGVPPTYATINGEVAGSLPWDPAKIGDRTDVRAFNDTPAGDVVLARASGGAPIAALRRFGAGHVVYCADARLFENGSIGLHDNARFVLALCAGRSSVTFDDRWVTMARAEVGDFTTMSLVYGTPVGRGVIALLLTGALAVFLGGIQLGGPTRRDDGRPPVVAYVDALAEAMIASRKGGEALRQFQDAFRRAALKRLGLPPDTTAKTLSGVLATVTGGNAKDIRKLLEDRVPDTRVADTVRRLDELSRRTGT